MNDAERQACISLTTLADRWGCEPKDVVRFIRAGKLIASIRVQTFNAQNSRHRPILKATSEPEQGKQSGVERAKKKNRMLRKTREIREGLEELTSGLPTGDLKELNPSEVRREWQFRAGDVYVTVEEVYRFERANAIKRPAQNPVSRLRDSRRHKERCRAIASVLWENDPRRTIADVIVSDEITAQGCEGEVYAEKTLRNWIKDLAPDRSPGRPPKHQLK